MEFIVIFLSLAVNLVLGGLFRPYTKWVNDIVCSISNSMAKKPYKKAKRIGGAVVWIGLALIWVVVELVYSTLVEHSSAYGYAIYAFVVFFCISAGQTVHLLVKMSNNTENTVFFGELCERLQVDISKVDPQSQKRVINSAIAKIFAERIIAPLVLIFYVGPGATLAYSFVNAIASADSSFVMKTHGFADVAVKLNNAVTMPAYWLSAVILKIANWVQGIKIDTKGIKSRGSAERRFLAVDKQNNPTKRYFKIISLYIIITTAVTFFALLSCYIFVEAVFAGLGLDEYLDYWNKNTTE